MSLTPIPNPLPGSVADGANVNQGANADAAVVGDNAGTVSAKLRGINKALAAALPLPTGAATSAKQPALGTAAMAASTPVTLASDQPSITVDGTFWQTTQPVSLASQPLPTGAATAAKQPALGTALVAASTPVNIASDQPAIPVERGEGTSGYLALSGTGTTAFAGDDVSAYNWVEVQITGNSSADTLTFQESLDGSTWNSCTLFSCGATQSQGVTSTTGTGMWKGAVGGYFQIAHSGGNTIIGTILLKQTPGVQPAIGTTSQLTPSTSASNAASLTRMDASASNNTHTSIKGSGGVVHHLVVTNNTGSVKFLKLYNTAAAPTVGTDTPVLTIAVPANDTRSYTFPPYGLGFGTGIGAGMTGGSGDSDTTALAAHDMYATIGWK